MSATRHEPTQRGAPLEAASLAVAIDAAVAALSALRAQLAAATEQAADEWISQHESPIPKRCFTRLCRERRAAADPRAAVRGRIHYLRLSLLDEYLRGSPRPRKAEKQPTPSSAGERLLAELGEGA